MQYSVEFTKQSRKDLKQIDKNQAKLIIAWVKKNLENCENPRIRGKALTNDWRGYWRYRVGSYRLIAKISDSTITIVITNVGHRREVYNL